VTRDHERPRGWSRTRGEQRAYMRRWRSKRARIARAVDALMAELRAAVTEGIRRGMR
jgi:hypothetical protein